MKNCKYTLVGKRQYDHSYDELVNIVSRSPELAYDILYSKDYNLQTRIADKLSELKESGKRKFKKEFSEKVDIVDGGALINTTGYTTLSLIDSGLYVDNTGKAIMPPVNPEEYIERKLLSYINKGLSKDEIDKNISILRNSWTRIAEDGRDLHKILLKLHFETSYALTEEHTKDTSFQHLSDIIKNDVYPEVYKLVFLRNGKESKELSDTSRPIPLLNINLEAKLIGGEETVTGHIDYLIVLPDGSIEIFNIKSSHENPSFWDPIKMEKYVNEFAILSRILLYNGINTDNIRFNIIPAVLNYDEQFLNIDNININKAICLSHRNGKFVMHESMNVAKNFISSNIEPIKVDNASIDNVNTLLKSLFPKKDIKAQGIVLSAEEFIDRNWNYWLVGELPDYGYKLTINGKIVEIKDSVKGSKNKELLDYIVKNLAELIDSETGPLSARGIISQFKQFRRFGIPVFDDAYMLKYMAPYFEQSIVQLNGKDKYNYKWEIINDEAITNSNVLLLKNTITNQINIVILSAYNLDAKQTLNGNHNVLGYHLSDMLARDNQGHELMRSTYGNIETMRSLILLNEIIPKLGTDVKLGDVSVIGGIGGNISSLTYPIELVAPNLIKAISVLNKKETNQIKNNFETVSYISPTELLINEFWNIMQETPELNKTGLELLKSLVSGSEDLLQHLIDGTTAASIASAERTEIVILRVEELIQKLTTILKNKHYSISPDKLIEQSKLKTSGGKDTLLSASSKLLIEATLTLARLTGIVRIHSAELTTFEKYFARPLNIADSQIKITSKLFQDAIHITMNSLDPIASDINNVCLEYYEHKGYSKTLNALWGNLSDVFTNLFEDIKDELFFKNPYSSTSDLTNEEKTFLKKMLFLINKVRFKDKDFSFTDENSKLLESFIASNPSYFWVPLERASESTKWSNPTKYFQDFQRRMSLYIHNPSLFFKEMYEGILSEEEEALIESDIYEMLAYNPFRASETQKGRTRILSSSGENIDTTNSRIGLLAKYGKHYFETNILNLVIDYIYKDIQEEQMNRMLIRAKGILLGLKLSGELDSDPKKYAELIAYIDDYVKTSVFNRSIMNEDSKKWISRLLPLRRALTKCYIALNPTGSVRDVIGGFTSNFMRALTKYLTGIGANDVLWAYTYVLSKGPKSAMSIDLLDKFNSKYLISNINIELLLEGYKTNRGGITNPSNFAYATLRKPDFLNRMVLFMANLKKDGSHKAYSIVNGLLVYNWRNDNRFTLLANNDKSNILAYNNQKGLYLSLLQLLNEEDSRRGLVINLSTNLPEGYTLKLVESMKLLSDTIYGSYNKSTKAKHESMAISLLSGVFSTWMNGIYDVYFGNTRESSYETEKVLGEDSNGNKLWIDKLGNIVTEDTGVPYVKDIPLMVQGVYKTLKNAINIMYYNEGGLKEGWDALKTLIWNEPMQRRNVNRLLSDLLVSLLMALLIKLATDEYKDHKKESDGRNVAVNAITELLYKGFAASSEEFKGPLPIFDYVMNNTKPASWLFGSRVITDTMNMVFGDKTVGETVMKLQALLRSFLDSYRMYQRDSANGIEE